MISKLALLPSWRTIRRLDIVSIVIVFGAFGLLAGTELWELARVHRELLSAATGLEETGRAIASLAGLPLIGDDIARQANNVTQTAAQVQDGALMVRDGVRVLAVVIDVTIALLAVAPVTLLYLPLQLARRRELKELRRMLSEPVEPMLVAHLAHVAIRRLPYSELRRISQNPWRDVERGDHAHLATAELRRLGMPARRSGRSSSQRATFLSGRSRPTVIGSTEAAKCGDIRRPAVKAQPADEHTNRCFQAKMLRVERRVVLRGC